MQYHHDWFMRQIEEMVSMLGRMVFGKEGYGLSQRAQYPGVQETESELFTRLMELIHRGEICQAENLLYEHISLDLPDNFPVAVEFYRQLNLLSDSQLEAQDFSREEILEGLTEVCRVYGVDPMLGFMP